MSDAPIIDIWRRIIVGERKSWVVLRDEIMLHALRLKFAGSPARDVLLSTGRRPLVEASPFDGYWGAGRTGRGKNRLGQLLVQVRAELLASLSNTERTGGP